MPTSTKERKGRQEKTVEGIGIVMTTEPSPARVGENRIRVQVNTGTRKDVPSSVSLTYTMPMPGMMPATVAMKPSTEPDGFEATVNLGMAGQWDLTVTVSRPDRPVAKATFSVRAGGM